MSGEQGPWRTEGEARFPLASVLLTSKSPILEALSRGWGCPELRPSPAGLPDNL